MIEAEVAPQYNPASPIDIAPAISRQSSGNSDAEANRISEVLHSMPQGTYADRRTRATFFAVAYLGLRLPEALAIRRTAFNSKAGTLTIECSLVGHKIIRPRRYRAMILPIRSNTWSTGILFRPACNRY